MKDYFDIRIEDELEKSSVRSFSNIYLIRRQSRVRFWTFGVFLILLAILFLPWTQNIRSVGAVTTLKLEDRPQELNTILPGKIQRWYVKEGDMVRKGDTILQLAEIKVDYLDPQLLQRTKEQLTAKEQSIEGYKGKAAAAEQQMQALAEARRLKIEQLQNKIGQQRMKISSDSMDWLAAVNDWTIANRQYQRQKMMFDSGLVSLTQLEQRNLTLQNALAKKTSTEIKYGNARQELMVLQLELNGAIQDYNEKISKASGDRYQSLSQVATGESDVAKLRNQYTSYDIRSQMYFIIAPQDGQITKARKAGIGEVVKEGEMIVEIVPTDIHYGVELYVRPLDLPLLSPGQNVRFLFDGFPAIVFSGWPSASYGTFGGVVTVVENSVSPNGKFRVLVGEDPADRPWPKELKVGSGAQGMMLLKDVPVWYELWRNVNGFPPEYYRVKEPAAPKK